MVLRPLGGSDDSLTWVQRIEILSLLNSHSPLETARSDTLDPIKAAMAIQCAKSLRRSSQLGYLSLASTSLQNLAFTPPTRLTLGLTIAQSR